MQVLDDGSRMNAIATGRKMMSGLVTLRVSAASMTPSFSYVLSNYVPKVLSPMRMSQPVTAMLHSIRSYRRICMRLGSRTTCIPALAAWYSLEGALSR